MSGTEIRQITEVKIEHPLAFVTDALKKHAEKNIQTAQRLETQFIAAVVDYGIGRRGSQIDTFAPPAKHHHGLLDGILSEKANLQSGLDAILEGIDFGSHYTDNLPGAKKMASDFAQSDLGQQLLSTDKEKRAFKKKGSQHISKALDRQTAANLITKTRKCLSEIYDLFPLIRSSLTKDFPIESDPRAHYFAASMEHWLIHTINSAMARREKQSSEIPLITTYRNIGLSETDYLPPPDETMLPSQMISADIHDSIIHPDTTKGYDPRLNVVFNLLDQLKPSPEFPFYIAPTYEMFKKGKFGHVAIRTMGKNTANEVQAINMPTNTKGVHLRYEYEMEKRPGKGGNLTKVAKNEPKRVVLVIEQKSLF